MNHEEAHNDIPTYIKDFTASNRMGALLGLRVVSLSDDECILEYTVNPDHYNPNGTLHGGVLFTAMDSSQGCLIKFILDDSFVTAATGTGTIKYLAPVLSGTITIRTTLKERQNRKFFLTSTAVDESGTEVAVLDETWIGILK